MSDRDLQNFGDGFYGFQNRITAATAALGGGAHVRKAVEREFEEALQRELKRSTGSEWETVHWSRATVADFDYAGLAADSLLGRERNSAILAEAPFNGVALVLREEGGFLVGGEYSMTIALISEREQYDSRTGGQVKRYMPFITSCGLIAAHGSEYASGELKSTTAHTRGSRIGVAAEADRQAFQGEAGGRPGAGMRLKQRLKGMDDIRACRTPIYSGPIARKAELSPEQASAAGIGYCGPEMPDKGLKDGSCNRTACQMPLAGKPQFWMKNYVVENGRLYYCAKCARDFAYWDRIDRPGEPLRCTPDEDNHAR
jgi:hypothetical protein